MYALRMTPPKGEPEYIPEGFGFTAHEHAKSINGAARWPTEAAAIRAGNAYRWPPAFWNGEREHAKRMAARFAGWQFDAVLA